MSHSVDQCDLPDGSSIMTPWFIPNGVSGSSHMVMRQAEYIGSFSVEGLKSHEQADKIGLQLESMRTAASTTPVIIAIGLCGIKVYNETGRKIYMGHAMHRISYANCDPEYRQFSFLSREPNGPAHLQYCHVFLTDTSQQAEELNNIIGDAFKMSYTRLKTTHWPPNALNKVIDSNVVVVHRRKQTTEETDDKEELAKRLRRISTSSITSSSFINRQRRSRHLDLIDNNLSEKSGWKYRDSFILNSSANHSASHGSNGVANSRHSFAEKSDPAGDNVPNAVASCQNSASNNAPKSIEPSINVTSRQKLGSAAARPISAYIPPSSRLSRVFRPISAAFGFTHNEVASCALLTKDHLDIDVANAAANAFRQASAQGGACPVVAMKESIDQSSAMPSTCGADNADIVARSVLSAQDKEDMFSPALRRSFDDIDWSDLHSSVDQASPLPPPPPLPIRYDSLRSKYDANFAADNTNGVVAGAESLSSLVAKEATLERATWYQEVMPREIVLDVLSREELGGFVVRNSTTHFNCFALSVKVSKNDSSSSVVHYLIQRTPRGVKLKGLDKEWPSLHSLVIHLTVMPEMLPCPLKLPRRACNLGFEHDVPSNVAAREDERSRVDISSIKAPLSELSSLTVDVSSQVLDPDDDEDYKKLSDFSSMMADLRVK